MYSGLVNNLASLGLAAILFNKSGFIHSFFFSRRVWFTFIASCTSSKTLGSSKSYKILYHLTNILFCVGFISIISDFSVFFCSVAAFGLGCELKKPFFIPISLYSIVLLALTIPPNTSCFFSSFGGSTGTTFCTSGFGCA